MKMPLLSFWMLLILPFANAQEPGIHVLQDLKLEPNFDLSEIRLDIIRQTSSNDEGMDEDVSYHSLGFDLGNGLFYDLNNNLSFNVLSFFQLSSKDTFTIIHVKNSLIKTKTKHHRTDSMLTTTFPLLKFKKRIKFEYPDSNTVITNGFLTRSTIYRNDSELIKQNALNQSIIRSIKDGYEVKAFLSKRKFSQNDNELILHRSYKIIQEGNEILIYRKGLFTSKRPIKKIIFQGNSIHIQSRWNRSQHITYKDNKVTVWRNDKNLEHYELLR